MTFSLHQTWLQQNTILNISSEMDKKKIPIFLNLQNHYISSTSDPLQNQPEFWSIIVQPFQQLIKNFKQKDPEIFNS